MDFLTKYFGVADRGFDALFTKIEVVYDLVGYALVAVGICIATVFASPFALLGLIAGKKK